MSDETSSEDLPKAEPAKKKSSRKKAPATKRPKASLPRARVYRFEQWAARREIPDHHRGGLRAYVKNVHKPRTLEEWDKCFKDY